MWIHRFVSGTALAAGFSAETVPFHSRWLAPFRSPAINSQPRSVMATLRLHSHNHRDLITESQSRRYRMSPSTRLRTLTARCTAGHARATCTTGFANSAICKSGVLHYAFRLAAALATSMRNFGETDVETISCIFINARLLRSCSCSGRCVF